MVAAALPRGAKLEAYMDDYICSRSIPEVHVELNRWARGQSAVVCRERKSKSSPRGIVGAQRRSNQAILLLVPERRRFECCRIPVVDGGFCGGRPNEKGKQHCTYQQARVKRRSRRRFVGSSRSGTTSVTRRALRADQDS